MNPLVQVGSYPSFKGPMFYIDTWQDTNYVRLVFGRQQAQQLRDALDQLLKEPT